MLLSRFEYRAAKSVREAASLWSEVPGSKYLAGGTDLLPQMRARHHVARVVDLKRIPELSEIRLTSDGGVSIGGTATMAAVAAHPVIAKRYVALLQCIDEVGAWPLRNRATLAGNICNASPAADTAIALLALEAAVGIDGPKGPRKLSLSEFFKGPGKTALDGGEIVTEILLPNTTADFAGRYLRLSRRKGMDLATVGVLVTRANGQGPHRVALAAVAPTPLRVTQAELVLDEDGLSASSIQKAAQLAAVACSPITDLRGTAEYRREMVGVLTARGLTALA
ncbi:MAG TPA: xanthine dehydrogenase family protein subunit M [Myxococcales bacterium]|jgi:carbon-monoxide dehydrogenase medium subunit